MWKIKLVIRIEDVRFLSVPKLGSCHSSEVLIYCRNRSAKFGKCREVGRFQAQIGLQCGLKSQIGFCFLQFGFCLPQFGLVCRNSELFAVSLAVGFPKFGFLHRKLDFVYRNLRIRQRTRGSTSLVPSFWLGWFCSLKSKLGSRLGNMRNVEAFPGETFRAILRKQTNVIVIYGSPFPAEAPYFSSVEIL